MLQHLTAIQKQQETSSQSLELLKAQHQEWQKSVEALLSEIRQGINSKYANSQTAEPVQRAGGDCAGDLLFADLESVNSDANFVAEAPMSHLPKESESDAQVPEQSESTARAEFGQHGEHGEAAQPKSSIHFTRRAGTLEELFRTRKTVVESGNQPVGLKKLVEEEMIVSESSGPATMTERCRLMTKNAVEPGWFEYASGFIILVNLITIGIEAEESLQRGQELGRDSWAYAIERIFLMIYCVEAALRLVAHGRAAFRDGWFLMDVALVTIGLLALLVAPNIGAASMEGVEKLLIVRGLRLLRLVRALRMVNHFKIMWRLVYGLLTAAETILATSALILVFMFVFSCVAVEVISKDQRLAGLEDTGFIISEYFGNLGKTVMTLMQFVTMDSLATIYFPLIVEEPLLLCFFLPILIFVSIGLMNLVTAALVENAMEHAAQQAEDEKVVLKKKVRGAMPSLLKIFHTIDKDNSGMITRDELQNVPMDILPPKVLAAVCVDNWEELFEYLDIDGTGSLSQVEFVEGLLNLCLLDMPIATIQTLKLLQLIRASVSQIQSKLQAPHHAAKLSQRWT